MLIFLKMRSSERLTPSGVTQQGRSKPLLIQLSLHTLLDEAVSWSLFLHNKQTEKAWETGNSQSSCRKSLCPSGSQSVWWTKWRILGDAHWWVEKGNLGLCRMPWKSLMAEERDHEYPARKKKNRFRKERLCPGNLWTFFLVCTNFLYELSFVVTYSVTNSNSLGEQWVKGGVGDSEKVKEAGHTEPFLEIKPLEPRIFTVSKPLFWGRLGHRLLSLCQTCFQS